MVLPRGIDHAVDMGNSGPASHTMALDLSDAYHWVPLAPCERRFKCCDLGLAGFLVMWAMGFGGRAFPLVFCRVISAVARITQTVIDPWQALLQFYMDDPIIVVPGSPRTAQWCSSVAVLLWLLLPAGRKASLETKHTHGSGSSSTTRTTWLL